MHCSTAMKYKCTIFKVWVFTVDIKDSDWFTYTEAICEDE